MASIFFAVLDPTFTVASARDETLYKKHTSISANKNMISWTSVHTFILPETLAIGSEQKCKKGYNVVNPLIPEIHKYRLFGPLESETHDHSVMLRAWTENRIE